MSLSPPLPPLVVTGDHIRLPQCRPASFWAWTSGCVASEVVIRRWSDDLALAMLRHDCSWAYPTRCRLDCETPRRKMGWHSRRRSWGGFWPAEASSTCGWLRSGAGYLPGLGRRRRTYVARRSLSRPRRGNSIGRSSSR